MRIYMSQEIAEKRVIECFGVMMNKELKRSGYKNIGRKSEFYLNFWIHQFLTGTCIRWKPQSGGRIENEPRPSKLQCKHLNCRLPPELEF